MIASKLYEEMISNMTYDELIKERDSLISSIRKFEKYNNMSEDKLLRKPPSDVVYQCELLYLAKVCELISERYNKNICSNDNEYDWIFILKEYLVENGFKVNQTANKVTERLNGKAFTLSEHVEGLIYSLLSNQRNWKGIEDNIDDIRNIFFDFDVNKIKSTNPLYFVNALCKIKCGNRDIHNQMNALAYNVGVMETIAEEYGSMDSFVMSAPARDIVKALSNNSSKYKLHRVGEALAWEYLRNIGIDGCKQDVHLCRFLGSKRMGYSNKETATLDEVCRIVEVASKDTGMLMMEIDAIIWAYCAVGYADMCGANPRCSRCPIKSKCNGKNLFNR